MNISLRTSLSAILMTTPWDKSYIAIMQGFYTITFAIELIWKNYSRVSRYAGLSTYCVILAIYGDSYERYSCNFHRINTSCLRLSNNPIGISIDIINLEFYFGMPGPGDEIWSRNRPVVTSRYLLAHC
jgi:hypothetical protein